MHGLGVFLADDFLQVVDQAFLVLVDVLLSGGFILERDLDAAMQVACNLEALTNGLRVEFDFRENLRIGLEVDRRAGSSSGAHLLQAPGRLSLLERHLVLLAVPLHRGDELA